MLWMSSVPSFRTRNPNATGIAKAEIEASAIPCRTISIGVPTARRNPHTTSVKPMTIFVGSLLPADMGQH